MDLDVPCVVRAAASPRGAGDRAHPRFRDLRLLRSAQHRQAGAEGSARRRRLRAAQSGAVADLPREEPDGIARADGRLGRLEPPRGADRQDLRPLRHGPPRGERPGFRRSPAAHRRSVRDESGRAHEILRAVPVRHGRRVSGHQPAAVPADSPPGRNAPQPVRGRRSRSVDLQVARRRSPEHPRFRAGLPRGGDRQARTQLPVDADHSRRRIGRHQPEPEPQGQAPVDRPERRSPDRLLPRRRRARGGRLHHPYGARRPGRRRRRDRRGPLSDERAVADHRRRADARGPRLQGRRRRPLLRAQGDQGCARLHAAGHQPA